MILGALFSTRNEHPEALAAPSEKNVEKGIVTRKGTKIEFVDDKKCKVSIETPEKNKVVLDDDARSIQLLDQNGNSVTLNKDGIEINAKKALKINAGGDLEITTKKALKLQGNKVDVK